MTLFSILLATLAAGIGSVWLAAALMRVGFRGAAEGEASNRTGPQHLLSLAAGALLATSFMNLLPESFEGNANAQALFMTLLAGLVFFFLLDKAELWHHGHEHHQAVPAPVHDGAPGHGAAGTQQHLHGHAPPHSGGWAVLTGDSVHCFGDGILIASAFVADLRLGLVASLSVLAHEVPHHIGDLAVLRMTSANRRIALVKLSLAGAVTALGGLTGWWVVDRLHDYLPYFLVVASSSFVYVALADLIPQLQKRLTAAQTIAQIAWLLTGIALVTVVGSLVHGHTH